MTLLENNVGHLLDCRAEASEDTALGLCQSDTDGLTLRTTKWGVTPTQQRQLGVQRRGRWKYCHRGREIFDRTESAGFLLKGDLQVRHGGLGPRNWNRDHPLIRWGGGLPTDCLSRIVAKTGLGAKERT